MKAWEGMQRLNINDGCDNPVLCKAKEATFTDERTWLKWISVQYAVLTLDVTNSRGKCTLAMYDGQSIDQNSSNQD